MTETACQRSQPAMQQQSQRSNLCTAAPKIHNDVKKSTRAKSADQKQQVLLMSFDSVPSLLS